MSGPKVVRVRTREELLAESQAVVERLEHAIARWKTAASDGAADASSACAGTAARHEEILALLAKDKFGECNQAALREIAYLADDTERLVERAAARRAEQFEARLRMRQNAKVLLDAILEKGGLTDAGLQAQLQAIARGAQQEDAERALAAGFRLLVSKGDEVRVATSAQMELARRLSDVGDAPDFAQWKRFNADDVVDARVSSLARLIERLRQHAQEPRQVQAFEDQLTNVLAEENSERRSMLLDSLQVQLATAAKQAKAWAALTVEAAELLAPVAALEHFDLREVGVELDAALASGDSQRLASQIEACRLMSEAHVRSNAARSRRDAVLQGLASLGYTVHEGMETAWVEKGRLVMHKTGGETYGVEVVSAADADRMQVRAVAFVPGGGASRDAEAEQSWCQDFTRLQQELAGRGTDVLVEKALSVGMVPLKVVEKVERLSARSSAAAVANRSAGR